MQPFSYMRAETPDEAMALLARTPGAKLLAGSTTLLDLMKLYVETPPTVIDVRGLGLDQIEVNDDSSLTIGALATNTQVAVHEAVRKRFPMLSQAILMGATQQIRNMASIGGNLLQRPFCPYFRDTYYACNKRQPGSGCPALVGHNRGHAILGTSEHCIATHPSDMAVALVALDAKVLIRTVAGETRGIPLVNFHLLPGGTPHVETVLAWNEMMVAVEVPALPFGRRSLYRKVRDRSSYQHALASVAVALDLEGETIRAARVAFGGIATKPWRSREAEAALAGHPATGETFRASGEAALEDARGHGDNVFKIGLAKRLLARTLQNAVEMSP